MLKPKNISIKKVMQSDPIADSKKSRNSRKSIKLPKRQINQSNNPSPIHLMKEDTNLDSSESDHGDFIKYINGYLNQLDSGKNQAKLKHTDKSEMETIKRKIFKQKQINRNLQKNIVQFQKILLDRTDKLDKLEDLLRKLQNKQNNRNFVNTQSQSKSRHKLMRKMQPQISSEFQNTRSQESESQLYYQQNYNKYKQRRKTQIPSEIQRVISRTMAIRPQKFMKHKN